jgi:putative hydrolase of HD superfamily
MAMNKQKINDILLFLERSKVLQSVARYSKSLDGEQNTVAEHSWRLALMAYVIGTECKVNVDMARTLALALVHDLAEAKTGDMDAYAQIKVGIGIAERKAVLEDLAMRDMTDDLSFGNWMYSLWKEFEDQQSLEAKFVKALDKIEGFLHIAEDGVGVYVPSEFHADYADKAVAVFDEATNHIPELKDFLDAIKDDLKEQFEKVGVAWIEGK